MKCSESSVHNDVPIVDLATSTDITKCSGEECKAAAKAVVAYQAMLGVITPMRLDALQISQVLQRAGGCEGLASWDGSQLAHCGGTAHPPASLSDPSLPPMPLPPWAILPYMPITSPPPMPLLPWALAHPTIHAHHTDTFPFPMPLPLGHPTIHAHHTDTRLYYDTEGLYSRNTLGCACATNTVCNGPVHPPPLTPVWLLDHGPWTLDPALTPVAPGSCVRTCGAGYCERVPHTRPEDMDIPEEL